MEYISYSFIVFVAAGLLVCALLPVRYRRYVLLSGSLLFVGLSGGFFSLGSLLLGIGLSFLAGRLIEASGSRTMRRWVLLLTVLFHLSLLFWFKYQDLWEYTKELYWYLRGTEYLPELTERRAPLGISFYTLMLIGYVGDIYMRKYRAETSLSTFALYGSYFGHIVQGPIDAFDEVRADMEGPGRPGVQDMESGALLMLYGLFKKLVIAERLAVPVNAVFSDPASYHWSVLLICAFGFTLQLYMDFSGCVDMVTGISRMFGIRLSQNFRQPFFSQSIAEFWRRWHMTLGAFFRKYVYIPLGGNRHGVLRKHLNTIVVFLLSGLWHGGNWTYIIGTGLLHCVYMILGQCLRPVNTAVLRLFHMDRDALPLRVLRSLWVFLLVTIGFVLFRSESVAMAMTYLGGMAGLQAGIYEAADLSVLGIGTPDILIILAGLLTVFYVSLKRELGHPVCSSARRRDLIGVLIFTVIVLGFYGRGYDASAFIYAAF